MIQPGNRKLGEGVWSWSLPAVHTCPGRSAECQRLCYARSGFFAMPSVIESYRKNLEIAEGSDFSRRMLAALLTHRVRILRIHASGDFHTPEYAAKWLTIVRRARNVTFYGYTRSWALPEILPKLKELACERNVRLWFSWDRLMPKPPRVAGVKTAYMAVTDEDVPPKPADLVFRVRRKGVRKFLGRSLVCPHEQGVEREVPMTCERCRLCFDVKRLAAAKRAVAKLED